jgi:hypothetical protein
LQFELLEGEVKLASRRKELQRYIESSLSSTGIDTPGWLLMALRDCNGSITAHTKATKDKTGQISLTLLMLNKAFSVFAEMLQEKQKRANTFAPYVVKRTQDILLLVKKLPMDEQGSFSVPFNLLLKNIYAYPPTNKEAVAVNLPKMY